MTYTRARQFIIQLQSRGIVPGLDNIVRLCKKLGNPQLNLKFIHIAGTNGKGSVGAYLESILRDSGMVTGRFVSPAVADYLEMYTINGVSVSEEDFTQCADRVYKAIYELAQEAVFPTAFEAETAIAFLLFQKYNTDIALIECGMGGLMDSTNVIPSPLMTIITPIAMDHSHFLGNTLSMIAKNKCGIIKKGTRVITCNQKPEVMRVIKEAHEENNASLYIAKKPQNISYGDTTSFQYDSDTYVTRLMGSFQPDNAATAICGAQVLGIDKRHIYNGIKNACWQFRFEKIGKYVLDGAHNTAAAEQLVQSIKEYFPDKSISYVTGIFEDKDYEKIAEITAPYADNVYTVSPPPPRGLASGILCETFRKYNCRAFSEPSLQSAIKKANTADVVIIFGSLSILSRAKEIIQHGALQ